MPRDAIRGVLPTAGLTVNGFLFRMHILDSTPLASMVAFVRLCFTYRYDDTSSPLWACAKPPHGAYFLNIFEFLRRLFFKFCFLRR